MTRPGPGPYGPFPPGMALGLPSPLPLPGVPPMIGPPRFPPPAQPVDIRSTDTTVAGFPSGPPPASTDWLSQLPPEARQALERARGQTGPLMGTPPGPMGPPMPRFGRDVPIDPVAPGPPRGAPQVPINPPPPNPYSMPIPPRMQMPGLPPGSPFPGLPPPPTALPSFSGIQAALSVPDSPPPLPPGHMAGRGAPQAPTLPDAGGAMAAPLMPMPPAQPPVPPSGGLPPMGASDLQTAQVMGPGGPGSPPTPSFPQSAPIMGPSGMEGQTHLATPSGRIGPPAGLSPQAPAQMGVGANFLYDPQIPAPEALPGGVGGANSAVGEPYAMQLGDTLYGLADAILGQGAPHEQKLAMAMQIAQENQILDPTSIKVGQEINLGPRQLTGKPRTGQLVGKKKAKAKARPKADPGGRNPLLASEFGALKDETSKMAERGLRTPGMGRPRKSESAPSKSRSSNRGRVDDSPE